MDSIELISKELKIPKKCCRGLSKDRFICLVHETWVKFLRGKRLTSIEKSWYTNLSEGESSIFLARSYEKVPKPWSRLSIKVIPKRDKQIISLIDEALAIDNTLTFSELMGLNSEETLRRLSTHAESLYAHAALPNREAKPIKTKLFDDVVREALQRVLQCPMLSVQSGQFSCQSFSQPTHCNISPAICTLESQRAFYVIHSYVPYTLWDAIVFSPAIMEGSYAKPLFILYQILQAVKHCHGKGLSVGDLRLNDIFVDNKLWVMLCQPQISQTYKSISNADSKTKQLEPDNVPDNLSAAATTSSSKDTAQNAQSTETATEFQFEDLPALTQKWMYGEITNFDYLMALNHLAGRKMGDPNHHPILPWVINFTVENGGYRDLMMSKYRLNKGDAQLDLTYDTTSPFMTDTDRHGDPLQIPHHISDMLSDITYFVYKARRIPKSVLCTHVRSKWVPNEYPSSMERMQQWTPDECIPEFYNDPQIFESIHEDLGNLEVPSWCSGPEDFVKKHMAVLEGEYVSQRLHHWIDLTFGYKLSGGVIVNTIIKTQNYVDLHIQQKLSGTASVKSKNVCLQLVDKHTNLLNHGVVPLFHSPHPAKLFKDVYISPLQLRLVRSPALQGPVTLDPDKKDKSGKQVIVTTLPKPSESPINLPKGYDPLAMLDQVEALYDFTLRATKKLPPEHVTQPPLCPHSASASILSRDLQALGCLVMEMAVSPRMRAVPNDASLHRRYSQAANIARTHIHEVPRPLRQLVQLLLQPSQPWDPSKIDEYGALFLYPNLSTSGLPPPTANTLLQPGMSPIPFPPYMDSLYNVLNQMKTTDVAINATFAATDTNLLNRHLKMRRMAKEKVTLFAKYLNQNAGRLGAEGLELIMPYVVELFEDAATAVQAAWCLFNPMAQALGPQKTAKFFLPLLTNIFDDESTTPKHMKLYHRTYVIQLIVRLGLETFLSYFSTLLVEASAGYKNFTGDDFDRQMSSDADMDDPGTRVSDMFMEGGNETIFTSSDEHDKQEDDEEVETNGDDVFPDQVEEGKEAGRDLDLDSIDSFSLVNNPNADATSLDPSEDITGKSLGRISVHSMSRLIEGEKLRQQQSGGEQAGQESDEGETDGKEEEEGEEDDDNGKLGVRTMDMRKSEHEEFSASIMDQPGGVEYNINDVAAETIKWLAHRLGPVLTAKYLSRNLLRMLALCYLGEEQLEIVIRDVPSPSHAPVSSTDKQVEGDVHAAQVLDCLACTAILFGEQFILLQYFTHLKDLIGAAQKKLNLRGEASLVGSLVLLIHIIPYISDSTLMDILQESIFQDLLLPLIKLVSSLHMSFPSGSKARRVICYKLIDVLYIISMRIGFEMTRQNMTFVLQKFFAAFNRVYDDDKVMMMNAADGGGGGAGEAEGKDKDGVEAPNDESDSNGLYFEIKMDSKTNEYKIGTPFKTEDYMTHRRTGSGGSLKQYSLSPPQQANGDGGKESPDESQQEERNIQEELRDTFTPELAHLAYIPFCRLAGGIHMEQNLINDDLIRQLCSLHDQAVSKSQNNIHNHSPIMMKDSLSDHADVDGGGEEAVGSFGTQMATGNKIVVSSAQPAKRRSTGDTGAGMVDFSRIKSAEMEMNKLRHLRGNWLAYWEHEVGLSDAHDAFDFKQIKLQTFSGHTNSVRALYVLDNENSFISASKDKTVKLWSLRSSGDGTGRVGCQWSYTHKKSIFAVTFIESVRLAASCDSTVHIWDPFMGVCVRKVETNKNLPITMVTAMPAPHTSLVTATSDSTIRFLDVRTGGFMYELKCCTGPAGAIRCATVSPDGTWLAMGFTSGVVSVLDARTGMLLASFKAHEGEVLQIKAYNNKQFVTSSFDQTLTLWNYDDGKAACFFKGLTEPVHCLNFYGNKIVSATTANKIGVHSSMDAGARYSNTKLKSDVFRGVLTTMAVLPLNRVLLLGADTGVIKLVA